MTFQVYRLPIRFMGYVLPHVEGEIEYNTITRESNLTITHRIHITPIVENIISSIYPRQSINIRLVPSQNFIRQGYIEYEILNNNIYNTSRIEINKEIPPNTQNSITYENIKSGNTLIDFHNESNKGRYYKQKTFNSFPIKNTHKRKENPFTRKPIETTNIIKIKVIGGAKKNKTKKIHKRKNKN